MPVILVEEELTYEIDETVFKYERLRIDDSQKLSFLCTQRGAFDQVLYDKACVAVGLRGYANLCGRRANGTVGPLAWPPTLPSDATPPLTVDQEQALRLLFPNLTQAEQARLQGVLYVVEKLPRDIVYELAARVKETSPEEVKKSLQQPLSDVSASQIRVQAASLPVATAAATEAATATPSPVTPEG